MGTSCTSVGRAAVPYHSDEPPDASQYAEMHNIQQLHFELDLSNVKLVSLKAQATQRQLSLQLLIDGLFDVILESKPLWKESHRARVSIDNYQLRKTYLVASVYNQSRVRLGCLQLNLFNIVVGPYHQDFPLKLSDGGSYRLSLDLKVSQLVQLSIKPVDVGIDLLTEHPGEVFSYTLKTIDDQGHEVESFESYKAETILYNKKVSNSESQLPTPTLKRRHSKSLKSRKSLVVENGKRLVWLNEQAKLIYKQELPAIQTEINVSKIANYGFQLQLWRVQTYASQDLEESISEEILLYADANINFNKIFVGQPTVVQEDGLDYEKRESFIVQKLWNQGKLLGSVVLKCHVMAPPFYRQMAMCTRTEKGVFPAHTVFGRAHNKQSTSCNEIRELCDLKQSIEEAVLRLGLKDNSRKQWEQVKARRQIFEAIEKMCVLLHTSGTVKHAQLYNYRSTEDLRKGQLVLLDVGFKLLEFLVQEDASVADASWKALVEFIGRDEFSLLHIGYTSEEQANLSATSKQAIEIRLKYQCFLEQALRLSLSSLTKKALLDNERVFTVLFTAQAFIRVPDYRQVAISLFNQGERQRELLEDVCVLSKSSSSSLDATLRPLLDWEKYFWQPLSKCSGASEENRSRLKDTLSNEYLRQKMSRRGISFFCLVAEYINHVLRLAPFMQINWETIPGYSELVSGFLCEMESRDIKRYPDSLKEASVRLLCNEDLLNIQVRLLFRKTNIHLPMTVLKTLELLDSYFSYFSRSNRVRLPACFDYKNFYAGLRILLNSDHSFVVTRTLSLIYHHYQLFSTSFRRDLSFCLMGQVFFKLFLSWCGNIRMMFRHILHYRVQRDITCVDQGMNSNTSFGKMRSTVNLTLPSCGLNEMQADEIRCRMTTVMNILENSLQKTRSSRHIRLDKEYYRKMKSKLVNRRLMAGRSPTLRTIYSECAENIEGRRSFQPQRHKSELTPLKQLNLNGSTGARLSLSPYDANTQSKKKNPVELLLTQIAQVSDSKERKRRRSSFCADCTMLVYSVQIGEVEAWMTPYLEGALKEYRELQATALAETPTLTIRMPMDQGDLRPDDIDEW